MIKRIVFSILAIMGMSVPTFGQSSDADRGLTISLDFGISRGKDIANGDDFPPLGGGGRDIPGHHNSGTTWKYGVLLTPRVGYRFDPKRELGLMFRYESMEYIRSCGYGAYYERTYVKFPKINLRLFVDWQYLYTHISYDSNSFTEIGAAPGVAYHLNGTGLDLRLCYLFLGFNDCSERKEFGGCLGRGNWIIDAGIRRLSIGASYTF